MTFTGKVILITGASSGIGAATAEHFAKLGGKIAIIGRNEENLKKTNANCKNANTSVESLLILADVNKDAQRIVDVTIKKFGKIDVLVNNAGILEGGSILTADLKQFDSVMNTNIRSVFELTKLVVPHLMKTEGNIVNVSSVAGLRSFPNALSYCISKAALNQFTQCTALDLAPMKIRVNSVNPGVIVTEIHKRGGMDDKTYAEHLERAKTTHALGRVGTPEEVAAAIAFLSGKDAQFITGTLLPIDGGKHAMCPR